MEESSLGTANPSVAATDLSCPSLPEAAATAASAQVVFINEGQQHQDTVDQGSAEALLLPAAESAVLAEKNILGDDVATAAATTTYEPDLTTIEEQPELGYQSDSSDVSDLSSGEAGASKMMQLSVQYRSLKNLMPTVSEEDEQQQQQGQQQDQQQRQQDQPQQWKA